MCNHYRTIPEQIADWAVWAGYRPDAPFEADVWPKRSAAIARIENGQVVPDTMQWGVPLATTVKSGKPRGVPCVDDRRVLNGIFWVLRSGAPWRDLPKAEQRAVSTLLTAVLAQHGAQAGQEATAA